MSESPAQRIESAIVRLEEMGAGYFVINGWLCEYVTTGTESNPAQEPAPLTSDPWIVTLHSTIDAQLAILRDAAARMRVEQNQDGIPIHYRHSLVLADAILGDTK